MADDAVLSAASGAGQLDVSGVAGDAPAGGVGGVQATAASRHNGSSHARGMRSSWLGIRAGIIAGEAVRRVGVTFRGGGPRGRTLGQTRDRAGRDNGARGDPGLWGPDDLARLGARGGARAAAVRARRA